MAERKWITLRFGAGFKRYAPELRRRYSGELRMTNGSWRADETYLRGAGKWTYLFRAVDSTGDTIDFLLPPTRDALTGTISGKYRSHGSNAGSGKPGQWSRHGLQTG